jgi:hypothetical protein
MELIRWVVAKIQQMLVCEERKSKERNYPRQERYRYLRRKGEVERWTVVDGTRPSRERRMMVGIIGIACFHRPSGLSALVGVLTVKKTKEVAHQRGHTTSIWGVI